MEQLWLSIFSNEEFVQFSYQSYAMGKGIHELQSSTTGGGGGGGRVLAAEEEFVCQFPFYWLIKEAIESKWETAKSSSSTYTERRENEEDRKEGKVNTLFDLGDNRQDIYVQLCEVLSESQLAIILNRIPEEYWNEFYYYYLGDILRSIHHVPHHKATDEYEVC